MKNFDAFKEHGDVIWNIANLLRGPYRPPQYRRVMIPLTVLRRLDCVLEETKDDVIAMHRKLKAETKTEKDKETGKDKTVAKYDAETIEKMINRKFELTFHNVSDFTFQNLLGDPDKLAPNLLKFMSGFSTRARKIIEKFNFADEIEKLEEANRLYEVVKKVAAVDRAVFAEHLTAAFVEAEITLDSKLQGALLAPGSLGERDPSAEICRDKKGDPEPDPELRDTENVAFPPGIALPLPLDYEGKKNKGIRHYLYPDIDGLSLDALDNNNVESIS